MLQRSLTCALALTSCLGLAATAAASTFVVNVSVQSPCVGGGPNCLTLGGAITKANRNPGPDVITFAIPGGGVQTIRAGLAGVTIIRDTVTIDGTTQGGYTPTTPKIELSNAGLTIFDTRGCVIKGLVINREWFYCIEIAHGGDHVIEGCFIGTDPTGTMARPPGDFGAGIWIHHSENNRASGRSTILLGRAGQRSFFARGVSESSGSRFALSVPDYVLPKGGGAVHAWVYEPERSRFVRLEGVVELAGRRTRWPRRP